MPSQITRRFSDGHGGVRVRKLAAPDCAFVCIKRLLLQRECFIGSLSLVGAAAKVLQRRADCDQRVGILFWPLREAVQRAPETSLGAIRSNATQARPLAAAMAHEPAASIRVPIEKVDRLVNLVGELVNFGAAKGSA